MYQIFDIFPSKILDTVREKADLRDFEKNCVFVRSSQNLTDFVKISQIFAFSPLLSTNFIKSH